MSSFVSIVLSPMILLLLLLQLLHLTNLVDLSRTFFGYFFFVVLQNRFRFWWYSKYLLLLPLCRFPKKDLSLLSSLFTIKSEDDDVTHHSPTQTLKNFNEILYLDIEEFQQDPIFTVC